VANTQTLGAGHPAKSEVALWGHVDDEIRKRSHIITVAAYGTLLALGIVIPAIMWCGLFFLAAGFALKVIVRNLWILAIVILLTLIPYVGWFIGFIIALVFLCLRWDFVKENWSAIGSGLFLYFIPPALITVAWYSHNTSGAVPSSSNPFAILAAGMFGVACAHLCLVRLYRQGKTTSVIPILGTGPFYILLLVLPFLHFAHLHIAHGDTPTQGVPDFPVVADSPVMAIPDASAAMAAGSLAATSLHGVGIPSAHLGTPFQGTPDGVPTSVEPVALLGHASTVDMNSISPSAAITPHHIPQVNPTIATAHFDHVTGNEHIDTQISGAVLPTVTDVHVDAVTHVSHGITQAPGDVGHTVANLHHDSVTKSDHSHIRAPSEVIPDTSSTHLDSVTGDLHVHSQSPGQVNPTTTNIQADQVSGDSHALTNGHEDVNPSATTVHVDPVSGDVTASNQASGTDSPA